MLTLLRAHVPLHAGMALLSVTLTACGGASPTTPRPLEAPSTRITVRVTPTPLKVTLVRVAGTTATYRVTADVTFTESGGTGARITLMTSSVSHSKVLQGFEVTIILSSTAPASMEVPPLGTATYTHTQEFGVETDVSQVTWKITASGTDSQGRPFVASSPGLLLDLAASATPGAGS